MNVYTYRQSNHPTVYYFHPINPISKRVWSQLSGFPDYSLEFDALERPRIYAVIKYLSSGNENNKNTQGDTLRKKKKSWLLLIILYSIWCYFFLPMLTFTGKSTVDSSRLSAPRTSTGLTIAESAEVQP